MSDSLADSAGPSPPHVSVVIASVSGLPAITRCLEALSCQEAAVPFETLVLDRSAKRRALVRERFPDVRVIAADATTSLPRLRSMGIERARGRVVAVLGDRFAVDSRWLQTVERVRGSGWEVVGGVVENDSTGRLVDWAGYLCEYASFMPPVAAGSSEQITGNNTVYDRRILDRFREAAGGEVWDTLFHARLRAAGVQLRSEPALVACYLRDAGYIELLAQRYWFSRSLAGMRTAGWPRWRRIAYALGTLLLPALLLERVSATVFRKRRRRRELLLAAPLIAILLTAGAIGEGVEALCGPGDSLLRVE